MKPSLECNVKEVGVNEPEPEYKFNDIIRDVMGLQIPVILGTIVGMSTELINTVLVGQKGTTNALAAVGFGNVMQNCCGVVFANGLAGGLDTLVSQAYGGGHVELATHYLQRARAILLINCIWIIPLLFYTEELLVFIGQDPEVAKLAAEYNRATIWGIPAMLYSACSMKFLACQRLVKPILQVVTLCAILHVGYGYYFVGYLNLGNKGAGYSNTLTWWISTFLLNCHLCSYFPNKIAHVLLILKPGFREWGGYLRVGFPAMLQSTSETMFWEICCMICGYLGAASLAAHVAGVSFTVFIFTFAGSGSAATATLVGNAIGAQRPHRAQAVLWTTLRVCLSIWSFFAVLIILFRKHIARVYSSDPVVIYMLQNLICIYSFGAFGHTAQHIFLGALRGLGRQQFGFYAQFIAYYMVMLPMSLFCGFYLPWGIYGVWSAFIFGTTSSGLVLAWFFRKYIDFEEICSLTKLRMQAEEQKNKGE